MPLDVKKLIEEYRKHQCFGDPDYHDTDHEDCRICQQQNDCKKEIQSEGGTVVKKRATTKKKAAKKKAVKASAKKKAVKASAKKKAVKASAKKKSLTPTNGKSAQLMPYAQEITRMCKGLTTKQSKNGFSFKHESHSRQIIGIIGSETTVRMSSSFFKKGDKGVGEDSKGYMIVVLENETKQDMLEDIKAMAKTVFKRAKVKHTA
jgi:hypothetical protein